MSLELIWTDLPYARRASAAATAGFDRVDLWNWRTSDVHEVAAACRDGGISINGFFGNRSFSLCDYEVRTSLLDEVKESIDCAVEVGAHQLHIFSNAIRPGGIVVPSPDRSRAALHGACLEGLVEMADLVAGTGITLALENLNPVFLPGYLWTSVSDTAIVARELARDEVGVVFDAYHQQLSGGRLTQELLGAKDVLCRIDIAEVPGRYEPGAGEIDFAYMRRLIDSMGWDGVLCFETVPSDGNPQTALYAIDDLFPLEWCHRPDPSKEREAI
ncbi:MAG: TIM barrel protein [Actinobacteria bacterium]|nr:TIM barrel protein [Actinomycetota bacterium]